LPNAARSGRHQREVLDVLRFVLHLRAEARLVLLLVARVRVEEVRRERAVRFFVVRLEDRFLLVAISNTP